MRERRRSVNAAGVIYFMMVRGDRRQAFEKLPQVARENDRAPAALARAQTTRFDLLVDGRPTGTSNTADIGNAVCLRGREIIHHLSGLNASTAVAGMAPASTSAR
jgi:hypothetical protein